MTVDTDELLMEAQLHTSGEMYKAKCWSPIGQVDNWLAHEANHEVWRWFYFPQGYDIGINGK